jgi:glutaredoxin-like protein
VSEYRLPNEQMLKREFERLQDDVHLSLFIDPKEDDNSFSVFEFMNYFTNLDSRIKLDVITKSTKPDLFEEYQITEVPAIVIEESGIRYTGIPAGPEASVFIQTLIMKSTSNSGIGEVITKILASLTKKVSIRTVVTSHCTICPLAVRIGNTFSLESALKGYDKIQHEIIDASEHEEYVSQFDVSAVPIILINDEVAFNGIPDVDKYIQKIIQAGK